MNPHKIRILFGGTSNERLVSTATAQNILENLPQAEAWFLSKEEAIYPCRRDQVLTHKDPFTEEFPAGPASSAHFKTIEDAIQKSDLKGSVVVLALHGRGVEDGVLQEKLERAGIAFTGSSAKASALAFNKLTSKKIAMEQGIRVAEHRELHAHTMSEVIQTLTSCIRQFERIALKPVADGSSVGLYILDGRSSLDSLAATLIQDARSYMIEEFIAGTELTVGIVGEGASAHALPPSEVRLNQGANFDYQAKYLGKGVEELTPARVSPEITRAAQDVALKIHRALGCEGYSRTDMIVTRSGPVYLETNTLPGMTKASFFPQQLAAYGSSIREFLDTEIERAWTRAMKLSSPARDTLPAHQ